MYQLAWKFNLIISKMYISNIHIEIYIFEIIYKCYICSCCNQNDSLLDLSVINTAEKLTRIALESISAKLIRTLLANTLLAGSNKRLIK